MTNSMIDVHVSIMDATKQVVCTTADPNCKTNCVPPVDDLAATNKNKQTNSASIRLPVEFACNLA